MYLHFIHHLYISRMLKGLYLPNRRCNKHDFVLIYADFTPPFGITLNIHVRGKINTARFVFFFIFFCQRYEVCRVENGNDKRIKEEIEILIVSNRSAVPL